MESIRALVEGGDEQASRLAHLEAIGPPASTVALPAPDALPPLLLDLAVPHEDIDPLVALLPTLARTPELRWLLERCAHSLIRTMGQLDAPPGFPTLREQVGPLRQYFDLSVFLAVLPHVQAYHRARGIPADIQRHTLADLGRHLAVQRRSGRSGWLGNAFWPMLHFRGALYQLGRLQFQRGRLGDRTGRAIAAAGLPHGPGSPALSVHIPTFYGPMTPQACDASFAQARAFFARHFPEETYDIAVCHSWLLDPQLADYLPANSNIIQFQRRFHLAYQPEADDLNVAQFIYGQHHLPNLLTLPQRTTLERAFVAHLHSGHHWHGGAGWCRL